MSKKTTETKAGKQAVETPPIELSDELLDEVQGGLHTPASVDDQGGSSPPGISDAQDLVAAHRDSVGGNLTLSTFRETVYGWVSK